MQSFFLKKQNINIKKIRLLIEDTLNVHSICITQKFEKEPRVEWEMEEEWEMGGGIRSEETGAGTGPRPDLPN